MSEKEDTIKNNLKLAFVQTDIHWENRDKNLTTIEEMLNSLPGKVDLIVLPETFATGFTMDVENFTDSRGESLAWMKNTATKLNSVVSGSLIICEDKKFYNRHYWVDPTGMVSYYDKRHLFRMGREQEHFVAGNRRVITNLGSVRFLLQTCYDIRFPVFSRYRGDYDVISYVANWPSNRQSIWLALLRARAIENQAYVIGVNRTGIDGHGVSHEGGSCLFDPVGNKVASLDDQPGVLTTVINPGIVKNLREEFPVLRDADDFHIIGLEE